MTHLFDLYNSLVHAKDFDKICISIASPEKIRSWSYGEIKTSSTLNYRTLQPTNEGLFCAKTFGPINNYECLCGKYQLLNHQGIVCERCGVEVTLAKVRRERMGHIELAAPIAHLWYFKSLPSRIGLLLDMSLRKLERVIYFSDYVVIDPGLTALKRGQLLSESAYLEAIKTYGNHFDARMGSGAIYELLRALDFATEEEKLQDEIGLSYSEALRKILIKRLKLVRAMRHSHTQPEWMVLKVLPVLPPDLRPLLSVIPIEGGGRFLMSGLNDLYKRVINRNNRVKRLLELKVPEVIMRNELRMLQEAVDSLLDNGRQHRAVTGTNKHPLQSLSDMIRGKQGRFRQTLLGKRVDYSGRAVIVVEPNLQLHQCGLPKEMALELFKPFLFHMMQKRKLAVSIAHAKKQVKQRIPKMWDILEEVVKDHPVLLNHMPTLSRLGIQAFEPVLVEGKTIQLHPLVAKTCNAQFDGDHMTVHIPLTIEAQLESYVLMKANHNIFSPIDGKLQIAPSQEMILGLSFMTKQRAGAYGEGMVFSDINEVQRAYETGAIDLQAAIQLSVSSYPLSVNSHLKSPFQSPVQNTAHQKQRVQTTVGRALLSQCLPEGLPYDSINRFLTKKKLSQLIYTCFHRFGLKKTIPFAEQLMHFGFTYATRAGISLSLEDIIITEQKTNLINKAKTQIDGIQKQYFEGLITKNQYDNKIIKTWAKTKDKMTDAVLNTLSKRSTQQTSFSRESRVGSTIDAPQTVETENALFMMTKAGGQNVESLCHLTGMRGLMIKPNGSVFETPILANFREGFDMHQYFISLYTSRKQFVSAMLKTAYAGYLTRRLVDVAQDVVITEQDCSTKKGITLTALVREGQVIKSLRERLLGRVVAEDIFISFKPVIKRNTLLDEKNVAYLEQMAVEQVKVRSPMTCQSQQGICVMCYGRDLARLQWINIGEAIGVIAAQSIGESCIQLSMRTPSPEEIAKAATHFNYIGDIANPPITNGITSGLFRIAELFEARIPVNSAILAPCAGIVRFREETKSKHCFTITDKEGQIYEFYTPKWQRIKISDSQTVQLCDVIVEGLLDPHDILRLKGVNELAKYMIHEMQEVYELHHISINDKHLEVMIHQMLRTVTIKSPGNTAFSSYDIVTYKQLIEENQKVAEFSGRPATWIPNLSGITKVSLSTESYLSAASLMDTTRVLFSGALNNKCDELRGIKENFIVGRLVPVGTGYRFLGK
jgi:DNA-directed RNA polymerase subunit beta'